MRRITAGLAATTAAVALLIGVKANSASVPRPALAGADGSRPAAAASPATPRNGSFTGSVIDTRYGPVQVRAVVGDGRLRSVVVLQQTDGGRSSQIDSYALPVLTAEALKAQNADIDIVSGATYTSTGYARSLQAALDSAAR